MIIGTSNTYGQLVQYCKMYNVLIKLSENNALNTYFKKLRPLMFTTYYNH